MRLMSMKLRQCLFLVSGLLFVAPAIATAEKPSSAEGRHSEHRALEDDVRHRGIIVLDTVYKTTPAVRHEMIAALQIYESLAEALASDDASAADAAAKTMLERVDAVSDGALREAGQEAWHQHADLYVKTLREFRHEASLGAKRSYFAHISEIVYCTVKSFGLGAELSNVYFCPMALDGSGAFWLRETDDVRNPYFGADMFGCGEPRETLGP